MTKKPLIKFFNLAVKQKVVYQPTLKHSQWIERREDMPLNERTYISSIESNLPRLRGSEASIMDYFDKLQDVETPRLLLRQCAS